MTCPGRPARKQQHWDVDFSSLALDLTSSTTAPREVAQAQDGNGDKSFLGEDRRFWQAQGSGRRRAGLSSNTIHSAQP